ncbi:MAG: DoxX family protein [Ignavibacteriales bacterium]|nr:DoxX family protein [Ignavibacteriales bacterium]MCF8314981.1 DoxX family protein [Ignavibacteriales bacterium]MCF8436069.1 DoxX family protein [Ignavibacteriales bacterium]
MASNAYDRGLLFFRIAASSAMIYAHGFPKLAKLIAGNFAFPDPLGIGHGLSLGLAAWAEFFGAAMIILGIFTRFHSTLLIITMSVVIFMHKSGKSFGEYELAFLYLLIFITLFITGPGKHSLQNGAYRLFGIKSKIMKVILG